MTTSKYAKSREPPERDPGPGWLRSRFMHARYPRPGIAPCGRTRCAVCGAAPIECVAVGAEEETTDG
jgi:hypothetical protein